MTDRARLVPIEPTVRLAWILWAAFVAGMVIYAVVPHFLVLEGEPVVGLGMPSWIAAGALAVAAVFYRRWALSDRVLKRVARVGMEGRPSGGGVTGAEGRAAGGQAAEGRARVLARYALTQHIIVLAAIETIAIIGFVYALLSRDASLALPFTAAAIALALLSFPRVRETVARGEAWG